jgi:hypothetical protein
MLLMVTVGLPISTSCNMWHARSITQWSSPSARRIYWPIGGSKPAFRMVTLDHPATTPFHVIYTINMPQHNDWNVKNNPNATIGSQNRCSWANIMTRIRAGQPEFDSGQGKGLFSSPPHPDGSEYHLASYHMGSSDCFLGVKAASAWSWSLPSNAEVQNAWSSTFTLPYVFMAWYLLKHGNNLTLLLAITHPSKHPLSWSLTHGLTYPLMPANKCAIVHSKSCGSSVGIALGYGPDDRGSRIRFPTGAGNFSLHHRVQNASEAHPASYPVGTGGSFPWDKVAEAWS